MQEEYRSQIFTVTIFEELTLDVVSNVSSLTCNAIYNLNGQSGAFYLLIANFFAT